jgi:hypothetical protein
LPLGIPGIGLDIEGAMQQAAQPGRQACGWAEGGATRMAASESCITVSEVVLSRVGRYFPTFEPFFRPWVPVFHRQRAKIH